MKEPFCLEIFQNDKITKIVNKTDFVLTVYIKPEKHKRKKRKFTIIPPYEFLIWDGNLEDNKIDLTKLLFSLEEQ